MDDKALVSIALCTYNGEAYLREQLDSIVDQSYPAIELIAVDDCSSDNTLKILEEYAAKYPYIQVFVNPQNLGYIRNFEKALQAMQWRFYCFIRSGRYLGSKKDRKAGQSHWKSFTDLS
jgi:glycosyltransferase involved in cell wall biosynthesis